MDCPKCGYTMLENWNWANCPMCKYEKKLYDREPAQERAIYEDLGFY